MGELGRRERMHLHLRSHNGADEIDWNFRDRVNDSSGFSIPLFAERLACRARTGRTHSFIEHDSFSFAGYDFE
jgi:hypothetical protein